MATILAIETSCDETAVALFVDGKGMDHIVLSQEIHQLYGGVVPELASRAHEKHITSLVDQLLTRKQTQASELDAVAFTQGPGLLGALLVGSAWAKAFAWAKDLPLIAVDHLQAHNMSHFIEAPHPSFPFLSLLASGGHTQLLKVHSPLESELLGQSKDDAVGEAFDKIAQMLGLPYPGGPALDQAARKGNPYRFTFPRTEMPELDYSFSGLKTACMYFLKEKKKENPNFIKENLADLCASIEHALVCMLIEKLRLAQDQTQLKQVCVAGGTAANTALRQALQEEAARKGWSLFVPKLEYCTDNAAMIACTAHYLYEAGLFAEIKSTPYSRQRSST